MNKKFVLICALPRLAVALCVGGCVICGSNLFAARTSADYSIPAESVDSAGGIATSTDYSVNGSAVGEFGAGGTAVSTSTDYIGKYGYVGELYDLTSFAIAATPAAVNEGANSQLSGQAVMDDATTLPVSGTDVTWSVGYGPVASLTIAGFVTTSPVLGPTNALLNGNYQGFADPDGTLLNVIDTGESDNYAQYGGDGIDDGWQVNYFGQPPNSNAGPSADPDSDGQNNQFEFTAGLIPNDPTSRFVLKIQTSRVSPRNAPSSSVPSSSPAAPTPCNPPPLLLSPNSWTTLPGTTQSDNGNERTVTDLNATRSPKFSGSRSRGRNQERRPPPAELVFIASFPGGSFRHPPEEFAGRVVHVVMRPFASVTMMPSWMELKTVSISPFSCASRSRSFCTSSGPTRPRRSMSLSRNPAS